jgi:hypothetical protein
MTSCLYFIRLTISIVEMSQIVWSQYIISDADIHVALLSNEHFKAENSGISERVSRF